MFTVWTVQCSRGRLDSAHPEESMASAGQTCAVQPAAACHFALTDADQGLAKYPSKTN